MSSSTPSTTAPAGGFVGQAAGGELGAAVTDEVRALIRTALDEDLRYGPDVTSTSTVPADAVVDAAIISRALGVIAGVPVVEAMVALVLADQALLHRAQCA